MIKKLLALLAVSALFLVGCGSDAEDSSNNDDSEQTSDDVTDSTMADHDMEDMDSEDMDSEDMDSEDMDSDDGASTSGFVSAANELCVQQEDDLDAKITSMMGVSEEPSDADLEELVGYLSDSFAGVAEDIDGLDRDGVDSDKVDELVDALNDMAEEIESVGPAILEGDGPEALERANDLATELGLEDCDDN